MAAPLLSFDILRNSNFRLLLVTRMLGMTALQAQAVIVGWQVYSITKSPFMLGLTGLAEALPALACALFAGHIVDTRHPRHVYLACFIAMAVNTVLLLIFAGDYFGHGETVTLWALYIGVAISGLARGFLMPASFAITGMIVPRNQYSAAAAWLSTAMQVAMIGGPALGGIIYGGYGAHTAWWMPVILMIMATFMAFSIQIKDERKKEEIRPPAMQSIREGWEFLLENRALLSIMSLDMLAVLFGGAVALLPAFADQVLHVGAEGLGLLRAAPALGAVLTGLYFALRPMKKITAVRMLIVVGGFGICMIGFGASTAFWLSVFFLSLSGAFDSVSMVIRGTLMQLLTPDHMRGRVSSVNSMFIISSNELGAFESGVAAALIGLKWSVVLGGMATLAVAGAVAGLSPKFRKLSVES
jgi:MFS family permease